MGKENAKTCVFTYCMLVTINFIMLTMFLNETLRRVRPLTFTCSRSWNHGRLDLYVLQADRVVMHRILSQPCIHGSMQPCEYVHIPAGTSIPFQLCTDFTTTVKVQYVEPALIIDGHFHFLPRFMIHADPTTRRHDDERQRQKTTARERASACGEGVRRQHSDAYSLNLYACMEERLSRCCCFDETMLLLLD